MYFLNLEYVYLKIYEFIASISFASLFSYWKIISFIITFSSVAIITYCAMRLKEIHAAEHALLYGEATVSTLSNTRFERVIIHIGSANPSDWRLAILEADIMLEDMLEKMQYHGETVGDKLKQVEKSDFATIDSAWEAHRVRNIIAHEGSVYEISQREARRVIELYRAVFEEFKYI